MRFWIGAAALLLAACGDLGDANTEGSAAHAAETAATQTAPPAATTTATPFIGTASDARALIERAGYTNVANIGQDAERRWIATAQLNGQPVDVMIDAQGVPVIYEPTAQ